MTDLHIIGVPHSNFTWTCRTVCVEKGVPYTFDQVRPHTPEVESINPFGLIPVMRHGEVQLFEARAICTYIDRAFSGPSIVPLDPKKYNTQFIVKASVEEALFEISWMSFADDDERKDVLMYIDWRSADVSDSPSVDCFHVIANNELKDQFKRLVQAGKISTIVSPCGNFSLRVYVTGWAIIDYMERMHLNPEDGVEAMLEKKYLSLARWRLTRAKNTSPVLGTSDRE